MFQNTDAFNQSLDSWDVSSVTNMRSMFWNARSFNQPLSSWDVSSVTNMLWMFRDTGAFNQPLSSWDVSSVTNMNEMFRDTGAFNQPLSSWDVSSITNMLGMFRGATAFNGDISDWDVSSVTSMVWMFYGATSFNQPLDSWNVSSVTNMLGMFFNATSFNQPLNSWNVSSVTSMTDMFYGAVAFNQPLSSWDVSSATNMSYMFDGASAFEQNLGSWHIVLDDTSIDYGDTPGTVGGISAQNAFLDQQNPVYGISPGGDSGSFELNGTDLVMKEVPTKDSYTVTLTATATGDFGTGNSRIFTIAVSGLPTSPPPPPPPPPSNTGGGGSSGSSGGGGSRSPDQHGDTPGQATAVTPHARAPWAASTPGHLNSPSDVDYFTLEVPYDGVLVVETAGSTDTVGTVWQAGVELATATGGGAGQNFHLSVPVQAGAVMIAVASAGRTGSYHLETRLVVGFLENPGPASFQSGIGVVSGWVCTAEVVEIALNGAVQEAGYGTARSDTAGVCGDTDNGFGLLFNWNLLGDGEHEVVAYVDGVELARTTVTVTTLGAEFLRDVTGECTVADFPSAGEGVRLVWQQAQQNFVLAEGAVPRGPTQAGTAGVGYLENPSPNSFQSGIGVVSGWVCAAGLVEIEIGHLTPQVAAYGTERRDTQAMCGDSGNGFGLLFNWNLLGDGEHDVIAYVNNIELGRVTVRVTTLGEEFVRGAVGECTVADFPSPGERVTLTWQQSSQNFVISGVE